MELICIHDCDIFKKGEKCWSVGEETIRYDRYDEEEFYIFYTDYDYDFDSPISESIPKWYFATPAEWRDMQIDSILKD